MYPMQPVLLQQYPLPLLPPSVRSVLNTGSKFVEETIAVAIRQYSRVEKTKLFIYQRVCIGKSTNRTVHKHVVVIPQRVKHFVEQGTSHLHVTVTTTCLPCNILAGHDIGVVRYALGKSSASNQS